MLLVSADGLEGQAGLADAADTRQRYQRRFPQCGCDAPEFLFPSDEAGGAPGHVGMRPGARLGLRRPRDGLRRFAFKDRLVHVPQRRTRIDTELLDEPLSHMTIGVECVGLTATAVLGQHQLPCEALIERVSL